MKKILLILFLLAGCVQATTCGSTLSLLNFGDRNTGEYLNVSIYTTIDPNHVGVRTLDAVIFDPSGRRIYDVGLGLNETQYVVNYSIYINEFWLDGTHKFNTTISVRNKSNIQQELCNQSAFVPFEVYSNRSFYEGNLLFIDFNPSSINVSTTVEQVLCINMSVYVPMNVSLPEKWNTTNYFRWNTTTSPLLNLSAIYGFAESCKLNTHQYNLDRDNYNLQRQLLIEQNKGLLLDYQECINTSQVESRMYGQTKVDLSICVDRFNLTQNSFNSCRNQLSICESTRFNKEQLYLSALAGAVLSIVAFALIERYMINKTPDED